VSTDREGSVATDWGPIVQTGIGAGAAIGGGFISAWVQGRYQRRMERDRRRELAAEVLAAVRALLTDATPDPLGLFAHEETSQRILDALHERWQRIRVPLLTLGAGHPSRRAKRVRDLARQLETATAATLAQDKWLVSDVLRHRGPSDTREAANKKHAEAVSLLGQLEEAIPRA
jgi:hypothetical protein